MTARRALIVATGITLALAGCGKADTAPGPGGVSVGEARALDEAAEMIEDNRLDPAASPTPRTIAPAKPDHARPGPTKAKPAG